MGRFGSGVVRYGSGGDKNVVIVVVLRRVKIY